MKIAIIVLNLDIGGTQRVSVDLANAFYRAGDEAHLITFGNKEVQLRPNPNIYLHHFRMQDSLKKTIIALPFIILGKIINIFFRKSFFYINGLLMTPLFKYKISKIEQQHGKFDLIIFRGNSVYELVWPLKDERVIQTIDNMNINMANTITSKLHAKVTLSNKKVAPISRLVEEKVQLLISENFIQVSSLNTIYGPLDVENIKILSKEYQPNIDSDYIVSVGRIVEVKNYDLLVDAYNYAYKHLGLKHKLVIVGDGPLRRYIEQKIESYGLEKMIILTGGLSNPFPWIKNSNLFILTSYSEGLGMALLEALACEVPVIATKSEGGVRDIMIDELKEYLVDFSEKDLGEKIVNTLSVNKKLDFYKYIGQYSPITIVNRYKDLYIEKN